MNKYKMARSRLVGACLLPWASSVAFAVPAGTYSLTAGTNIFGVGSTIKGTLESSSPSAVNSASGTDPRYGGTAASIAQVTIGTDPVVSVSAQDVGDAAQATSSLTYSFEATGSGNVLLAFNGSFSQNVADTENAAAGGNPEALLEILAPNSSQEVEIFDVSTQDYYIEYNHSGYPIETSGSLTLADTVPFSCDVYVAANEVYTITMETSVGSEDLENFQDNGFVNTASLDPLISIDPTYLANNPGSSLVFSDGFAPVPEPFGFSYLGAAAVLGLTSRRLRRPTAKLRDLMPRKNGSFI